MAPKMQRLVSLERGKLGKLETKRTLMKNEKFRIVKSTITHLCEAAGLSYRAPRSNEAVPKVRPIIATVMENIRYPPHHPPDKGENQEQSAYDAQMPQGYGWGQLQADMANLKTTQIEFYESILAQHALYRLRL
ncbi:hypothetical protein PIB30_049181 [Stylosanthes scabra]|uniref:Uncharacterized protein n=1 Tax=Stylosanthes scabra TaxID=79078 RepID=A0ABU6TH40_9FABA|nr:hypothetical protein [Stylosanthes scabra]